MVPLFARTILLTLAGLALMMPVIALAQLGSPSPLTITVSPQYLTPFGQATLTPLSDSIDISNATFILSTGGKEIYRGNAKPIGVTLGAAGSVTTVKATLTGGGQSFSQTVVLRPQDVALVIEPIASAPPLYLGKPLEPLDGTVRVVAMANFYTAKGVAIDPALLSYSWTVKGQQIASVSGIGRQSITVTSPLQYRAGDVSVIVQTQDGSQAGGDAISLSPQSPTLRIYENDPLLGVRFDHALSGSYGIAGTEVSLYAAAFSFPLVNGNPLLSWSLNGTVAQEGHTITLRPTGQGAGTADVSLTGSGSDTATANADLNLSFGTSGSSNQLGL